VVLILWLSVLSSNDILHIDRCLNVWCSQEGCAFIPVVAVCSLENTVGLKRKCREVQKQNFYLHVVEVHGGEEVLLHAVPALALGEGEWPVSRTGRSTPGTEPLLHVE
jgi:hypothetical protein